jgi:Na+/H+ antiporter NhaD/arsenite permease-like protein
MVVAASRPIIEFAKQLVIKTARLIPIHQTLAQTWVALSIVPLLGSLITEPAAMTLAALILAPLIFRKEIPEWIKYAAIGVLFVNISIGGTLTSYAAPPVLMIAANWQWDSWYMLTHFGWRTMIAVFINASLITYFLNKKINQSDLILAKDDMNIESEHPVPLSVSLLHVMFLAGVVVFAHHPIIFFGVFLMFLGFTTAYARFQSPMILKEGLLVGFFLAGLVVLGGLQQWWLQPIVEGLEPLALFFGAAGLTAITDNAALTYLGSLIQGMSSESKYMLVAGAVAGGGLTVIANAPNPAGATLLKRGFADDSIGAPGLFLGALPPTFIAMFFLLF